MIFYCRNTILFLSEIQNSQGNSIEEFTVKSDDPKDTLIKFISGGFLFWSISIFILFQKNKKEVSIQKHILNNMGAFILTLIIGSLLGWIATRIPTLGNVIVNVISFPIMLLILLGLIIYGTGKSRTT